MNRLTWMSLLTGQCWNLHRRRPYRLHGGADEVMMRLEILTTARAACTAMISNLKLSVKGHQTAGT